MQETLLYQMLWLKLSLNLNNFLNIVIKPPFIFQQKCNRWLFSFSFHKYSDIIKDVKLFTLLFFKRSYLMNFPFMNFPCIEDGYKSICKMFNEILCKSISKLHIYELFASSLVMILRVLNISSK